MCLFVFFFSFRAHLVDAKHKGLTDCPSNICLMAHVSEKKKQKQNERKKQVKADVPRRDHVGEVQLFSVKSYLKVQRVMYN